MGALPKAVAEVGTGWGIWLSLFASLAVSCLAGYLLAVYRRQASPYGLEQIALLTADASSAVDASDGATSLTPGGSP